MRLENKGMELIKISFDDFFVGWGADKLAENNKIFCKFLKNDR